MQGINKLHLEKLQDEQAKDLQKCHEKIDQWKKFKGDYEALQKKLISLPDHTNYDVKVPFGSLAFMAGKMIHTNEILVLLGDEWFAERSAKQAAEIIGRRILSCDKTLKDLEQERQQFENWIKSTIEMKAEAEECVDIFEEFDEEKEKLWREQHKLNVKKYKQEQKMAKKKNTTSATNEKKGDLWTRLDELEKLEIGDDELSKHENANITDQKIIVNDDDFAKRKSVRWTDVHSDNSVKNRDKSVLKISFSTRQSRNGSAENNEPKDATVDVQKIVSPADIYKQFCVNTDSASVKSILKPVKQTIAPTTSKENVLQITSSKSKETDEVFNKAFSYTVVERSASTSTSSEEALTLRKMSMFRAKRQTK